MFTVGQILPPDHYNRWATTYPQLIDQPSYYHFHLHAVAVAHDGGSGQAAGKAFLLGNVISQLETMRNEESGFEDVELTYVLGEDSELWEKVFAGLKSKKIVEAGAPTRKLGAPT